MSHDELPKADLAKAKRLIIAAIGPHASLREAAAAGLNVAKQRAHIIELCMPLVEPYVKKLVKLPGASRVELDDLYSSGLEGLITGIDRYNPNGGAAVNTYAYNWIMLRTREEIQRSHWQTMKPPRGQIHHFMSGQMDDDEREAYLDKYIRMGHDPFDNDWCAYS